MPGTVYMRLRPVGSMPHYATADFSIGDGSPSSAKQGAADVVRQARLRCRRVDPGVRELRGILRRTRSPGTHRSDGGALNATGPPTRASGARPPTIGIRLGSTLTAFKASGSRPLRTGIAAGANSTGTDRTPFGLVRTKPPPRATRSALRTTVTPPHRNRRPRAPTGTHTDGSGTSPDLSAALPDSAALSPWKTHPN